MDTHKSEVDSIEDSATASKGSLLQSMLQRLRKDEPSRSLGLRSPGGCLAEESTGGDNDLQESSRKFNTHLSAKKQGNVKYSPNAIPKWERRQLFLHPYALGMLGSSKQESENEDHQLGEREEQLHGWKSKPSFQTSLTVSETQERKSSFEIPIMSDNEDSSHNQDTQLSNISPQIKKSSGTVESVLGNAHSQDVMTEYNAISRENTDSEAYEDVLPLSSMVESLTQNIDKTLPDPPSVHTHNTLISNPLCYRVRKVKLSMDTPTKTKSSLITSTQTCTRSGDQLPNTLINEDQSLDLRMDCEDMHNSYSTDTAQDPSLKRDATGSTGSNTSLGKVSDKGRNTADRKTNITEKLKEKWREKGERKQGSGSGQDKESLYLEPDPLLVEEAMVSPTSFYEEQGLSENKTCLQRSFTLCDFKLDLGSMNLMDEMFTGDEWSKYLPVQECPSQEEDIDQSQTSSVHTCDDNEMSVTDNLDHHGLRSKSDSGSAHSCENIDKKGIIIEGDQHDPGVESNIYIYAIPTEKTDKPPENKTNPSSNQEESEDNYDYVEYMFPMPPYWKNSKPLPSLDFSVIRSQELLDNSMLKTRISLGKKRKHRPPGKKKKEKPSSTFYNIPSSVLQPPQQLPSSHSPSPQPTVFPSSVFYTHPSLTDSQESTSSQTLGSVAEKNEISHKSDATQHDRLLQPLLSKMPPQTVCYI
ncbi:uncharacterized protein si:dkey-9i23.6 isoform X1 [Alosa sapidissima]|uniref:uncharacterized protein si:dkey-9i23.6 isoform X1 n=1 Tax=Alosa sapidissima TaxID=34773 RepID=UPI001C0929FD|nr:uncharacterized protein si:dkey-9i23.6 isoform X1 [Alosa sapidissima]